MVFGSIEVEVVFAQLRDMHQPLDIQIVQRDEHAETRHRRDGAGKHAAQMIAHIETLQPCLHIARRIVGTAFSHRTMDTQFGPFLRRFILFALQHRLDRAMHQQIGIAADRRGKMRISIISQTEVADVFGLILGLSQGTQHHRLQQTGIRTPLDAFEQF